MCPTVHRRAGEPVRVRPRRRGARQWRWCSVPNSTISSPLAGLTAVFIFAAQMINFPVTRPALSGHHCSAGHWRRSGGAVGCGLCWSSQSSWWCRRCYSPTAADCAGYQRAEHGGRDGGVGWLNITSGRFASDARGYAGSQRRESVPVSAGVGSGLRGQRYALGMARLRCVAGCGRRCARPRSAH